MSEVREILGETVNRIFLNHCTKDLLEDADAGEWPEELWRTVVENGLTQVLLPEEEGGADAGWQAAYVILHAAGHFAAPIPLAETLLAGWLLDRAGLPVPDGIMSIVPEADGVLLSPSGEISGEAGKVPWAARADYLVGVARRDGGLAVYCAPASVLSVEPDHNIAREPRDRVQFSGMAEAAVAPADFTGDTLRLYGAMVRSAQMAGALERIVEDTLQYTADRTQFGRPIAKFQVIQQNMALTASEVAAAVMAAQNAFRAADLGTPDFEGACAKVLSGDAVGIATDICHETYGAIGFTYEHHLHFFTRRLWSWRGEFGAEAEWAEKLGRRVAARGPDALWSDITARQSAIE
ncbi:MAG: acyl-CoA dehydrogenase family protein [Pseudomonadota bacterium]|nr:acyl-CoA dehydrogenase family protein [Pseudomonadota bacterium]